MAGVLTRRTGLATATGPRGAGLGAIVQRVRLFLDLWSERRSLDKLDGRMLRDIGLECWQARQEAARAPWDVPGNRLAGEDPYRSRQGF